MAEPKAVYEIPNAKNIDGLNLGTGYFNAVHTGRLDDRRLKREEDILVASYPRTGTTWTCNIVSLLMAGEANYEETKNTPLSKRVPYLENKQPGLPNPFIDSLDKYPAPRVDKTHLPFRFINRWLTEDRARTIVPTRHPKDTLVSLFHFYKSRQGFGPFQGSWGDFFEHVKAEKQLYGDQLDWLQDWDRNKDKGDVLFLNYETMKQDIKTEMRRIAGFLDIQISEEHLQRLAKDVDIKSMQQNGAEMYEQNYVLTCSGATIVRKGEVGEWRGYFTEEQNKWFDNKYKQGYMDLSIDVTYD